MLIFPSNDDIIRYFAREYKDRINPSQQIAEQVLACSHYSGISSLRKLIRVSFSTLVNSPGKALSHLVLDEAFREPEELYERIQEILPLAATKGSRLNPKGITGNLMTGVIELTQLDEDKKAKRRVEPTYLIEAQGQENQRTLPKFKKNLDGFLFEPFAHAALTCSNFQEARSSYLIWGKANSSGITTSQETTLMVLYWLLNRPHEEGDEIMFIKEVCSHQGEDTAFLGNTSRVEGTINRLVESKILNAEVITNIALRNINRKFHCLKLSPAGIKLIESIDPLLQALGWYDGYKQEGTISYRMLGQRVQPDLKKLLEHRESITSLINDSEGWEIFKMIAETAHTKYLEDSQREQKEEAIPPLKIWAGSNI